MSPRQADVGAMRADHRLRCSSRASTRSSPRPKSPTFCRNPFRPSSSPPRRASRPSRRRTRSSSRPSSRRSRTRRAGTSSSPIRMSTSTAQTRIAWRGVGSGSREGGPSRTGRRSCLRRRLRSRHPNTRVRTRVRSAIEAFILLTNLILIDDLRAAVIFWSSGTSGKSKGVVLSHKALASAIISVWYGAGLGAEERLIGLPPL